MGEGSRPLRIGLVGAGAISRMHLSAFRCHADVVALTAVCDVHEQAARDVATSLGDHVETYADIEDMLGGAELDAVDICTPHDMHAAQAIAAAEAGKHVLVEKPMACSVHECEAMVQAAEAAGVTLMVGQSLRYLPANEAVRRVIAAGELGTIWSARADDWLPGPPTSDWMRDAERSGGGVLHMAATHHIDLFRFFFGNVGAVWARCWADNPLFKNGAEDRAIATLEFESGVVAQLSTSWTMRAPHYIQYMVFGDAGSPYTPLPPNPQAIETVISQHHATSVMWSASAGPDEGYVPVHVSADEANGAAPFVNEILHFAACVRDGSEPRSGGRDNLETMRTVYGCYAAARSGRRVELAEL